MAQKLVLLLLLLAPLLAACAPVPAAPVPTVAPAAPASTITFGAFEYQRAVYEPLAAEFNAANPDVQVQFISLDAVAEPGMAHGALAELARAADTFVIWGSLSDPLDGRYLRDLAPFIDADPTFARDDFLPGAIRADAAGAITLLPATLRVPLIAYNRELWSIEGLPPPDAAWDRGDVLDAAEQLAEGEGEAVTVYGLLQASHRELLVHSELGGLGSLLARVPTGQARLDDPLIVGGLERLARLVASGAVYIPPGYADGSFFNSSDYMPLIRDGRIAIWPAGAVGATSADPLPFPAGLAPSPYAPLAFFSASREGYVMSAGTQHPAAAWRWLAFLSRQPTYATGRAWPTDLPARRTLAEASQPWERLGAEGQAATLATLAQIELRPPQPAFAATPDGWAVYSALSAALDAVLDNGTPAAEALASAQASLGERLATRPPAEPTANTAAEPVVVATPEPTVAVAANAARVTFVTTDWNSAATERLAARFNAQFPQYVVSVRRFEFPSGRPVGLAEPAAIGDCGRTFAPPGSPELGAAFLDLQPLLDADPTFPLADYPQALLAPFQHDGQLLGLPDGVVPPVLFFNRELFDAAGLDYPSAGWTLADFAAAAERLTSGSGESRQYGFASLSAFDVTFFVERAGARLNQVRDGMRVPDFTNPAAVAAIQDYLTLLRAVAPNQQLDGYRWESGAGVMSLVTAGQVAIWFGHGFDPSMSGEALPFPTGVAPIPLGEQPFPGSDGLNISGLFISANAAEPAACWAFLRFLSEDTSRLQREIPARTSLAQSSAFLDRTPAGAADVVLAYSTALAESAGTATERAVGGLSGFDYYWLLRAVDRAFQGADLEQELADAQFLTEQYLACELSGERPAVCARQVDPSYDGWFRE